MKCEVLIIGGGVIGLSIARELKRRNVSRITVVDRGFAGSEASWAAAGMLAPNIETDTTRDFHRLGIESLELYPAFSDALLEETGVDIQLDRTGTLCVAFDDTEAAELGETYRRQITRRVAVERLSGNAVRRLEPSLSEAVAEALLYPNDWQVENRKLLDALRRYAELNGIDIVENCEVMEIMADDGRVTGGRTAQGEISAGTTVLATGAWTSLIKIAGAPVPVHVKPVRGQMLSFEPNARMLHHVVYSPRGYVVPRADGRILVGATVEDVGFDKSTTTDAFESLSAAAVEITPRLAQFPVKEQWAGLRPFAADGLPVLGGIPGYDDVYVATAHYRNGILLAPTTARIMAAEIVDGIDSEFLDLFGVERSNMASAVTP